MDKQPRFSNQMDKRKSRNEAGNQPSEDNPPHSRLFIVCSKQLVEDDFRQAFSKFGTIEDIRMPRDRETNETKGVAYIKFAKTSEAAKALEEMNFKTIKEGTRSIKVIVAASKSEVADDDEERYRRLFITVPRTSGVEAVADIRADFEQYGVVESVLVQTDKQTGEGKGFAYVKFRKFSSAALAYEECDRKFRPIFARPKKSLHRESGFESSINSVVHQTSNASTGVAGLIQQEYGGQNFTRLQIMCSPYLNQQLISRLFDIVPGMEACKYWTDLMADCGKAVIEYSNPSSAAYALKKFDTFEYPPGQRIFVKPDLSSPSYDRNEVAGLVNNLKKAMNSNASPDLFQLVETIAQASSLFKKATTGQGQGPPGDNDLSYCSQPLPPIQPLADINAPPAKRCFIVCCGHPPASSILRDVFCRFGNLIDVFTIPNKTVGYARYATEHSADEAIRVLHGAEVCGVRLKVMEAEERGRSERTDDADDYGRKRARFDQH